MSLPLSLDEEVRLYTTVAEREKYNLLANLFGIIVALDYLERAYVRDSVTAIEYVFRFTCSHAFAELEPLSKRYSPACTRLLSQYKTMLKLVGDDVPSIEEFMTRYRVSFSAPLDKRSPTLHDMPRWITQRLCTDSKLVCRLQ
jgi:ESCRT-I complex subunit VPS28